MSTLPIENCLSELLDALREQDQVVLQAPPGAGKTTRVPLAVLAEQQTLRVQNSAWLGDQKILLLEPRRLAARAAAERMASTLGEAIGETVGYRVRLESRVSERTRIEVITEGILTRYLQDDPSLEGVGLLIFDEFHERSLDADLGLALACQGRQLFRNKSEGALPLKLLVMSATLDEIGIADLLAKSSGGTGQAVPVVQSMGRQFPVTIHYGKPRMVGERLDDRMVNTIETAMQRHDGSLLVFLPGQGEIRAAANMLEQRLALRGGDSAPNKTVTETASNIILAPLYGDLSLAEQDVAIAPAPSGQRKIVLATSIAESSLTIEGVSIVIDSGLSRVPVFDPNTGMTRLHTRPVSQASSTQRAGRAGRLSEGHCYRLWSESQQTQQAPFSDPEIRQADLAPLALQLACWGIPDPAELLWLDPPAAAPYQQALDLLQLLGAIDTPEPSAGSDKHAHGVTDHGLAMASFPAHPRIAHMLLKSRDMGLEEMACRLAALLGERDILSAEEARNLGADIELRLLEMQVDKTKASGARRHRSNNRAHRSVLGRMYQISRQFESQLRRVDRDKSKKTTALRLQKEALQSDQSGGLLLALAYPDRIARQRQPGSEIYQLANGRAVQLRTGDPLQKHTWLVCAHIGGRKEYRTDQVFLAASLDEALFEGALMDLVQAHVVVEWQEKQNRFVAQRQYQVGQLIWRTEALKHIDAEQKRTVLVDLVRKKGLQLLPWTEALQQWRARVNFIVSWHRSQALESVWPDLTDQALLDTLEQWLGPYLDKIDHVRHFERLDLTAILKAQLAWPLPQQLEELAPERVVVPSGSRLVIDYAQNPPVLAVRLQEMLGCIETPAILKGRVPLMLHLLSPARRPLAVTQDLSSFWTNAYPDVKKELKGRYPKHSWPDNPLAAQATARAKPRKSSP